MGIADYVFAVMFGPPLIIVGGLLAMIAVSFWWTSVTSMNVCSCEKCLDALLITSDDGQRIMLATTKDNREFRRIDTCGREAIFCSKLLLTHAVNDTQIARAVRLWRRVRLGHEEA